MRIWYFDKQTGEILPAKDADKGDNAQESPRQPGVFIESIYSTRLEPPEYSDTETVVFNGSSWEVKPDYRNVKAWYKKNGTRVSITEIGVEPDGEFIETAPEGIARPVWDEATDKWREKTEKELYAELYATDRDKAIEAMRHECELALESKYYRRELPFMGYNVRADDKSQKLLTGYIAELAFGSRHYPQPWITCENEIIMVTNQSDMLVLVNAISQSVEQSILANRVAKTAIDNAANFEAAWTVFTGFRDAEI